MTATHLPSLVCRSGRVSTGVPYRKNPPEGSDKLTHFWKEDVRHVGRAGAFD